GEYFGYYNQTNILNTYRFNSEILELTSNFIQKNSSQLKKDLTALSEPMGPSFSFIGIDSYKLSYDLQKTKVLNTVKDILERLNNKGEKLKIFIIGRYHSSFTNTRLNYSNLEISYKTAHSVK